MAKPPAKQAKDTPPPDASPINGVPPPREYRWKPGQSGNPSGMPKGARSVTDRLRRLVIEDDDGKIADAIARAITKAALKGDHKFVTTILDRLDGPVVQKMQADVTQHLKTIPQDDADGAV
jgi:hypothetical protein